jgi:hypothetical protein
MLHPHPWRKKKEVSAGILYEKICSFRLSGSPDVTLRTEKHEKNSIYYVEHLQFKKESVDFPRLYSFNVASAEKTACNMTRMVHSSLLVTFYLLL